jgi:hypothetical protein
MAPKRRALLDPKSFLAQVGDGHSIGKAEVRSSFFEENAGAVFRPSEVPHGF